MNTRAFSLFVGLGFSICCGGCAAEPNAESGASNSPTTSAAEAGEEAAESSEGNADSVVADTLSVDVSGDAGAYTFAVELRSPDTGCERYADWWELLDASGALVHRRILGHSHVDEQPFTRSSGPIDVSADTLVFVRAHMHGGSEADGYGGVLLRGSVADGFAVFEGSLPQGAAGVHTQAPLPDGCAF